MTATQHSRIGAGQDGQRLLHREIFQLALLTVVAVVAFLLTRAIAANSRAMATRDAATWYERGQHQLQAGDSDGAIASLRRAAAGNREEKRYALTLGRALAGARRGEEARDTFLALRESDPEDADVNLALARLAAARPDKAEAIRYYHNALYAPWSPEQEEARRSVRLELIRFLLSQADTNRATSELVALGSDLPDGASSHVEVGQLLAEAGDHARALDHFRRALKADPGNGPALSGAGLASFEIGDYAQAEKYLRAAPPDARVNEALEIASLALSRDPLASRIGPQARRRRLLDDLNDTADRASRCGGDATAGAISGESDPVGAARLFARTIGRSPALGEDELESGLDTVYRLALEAARRCPPPTPLDRALILVGQRHGSDRR